MAVPMLNAVSSGTTSSDASYGSKVASIMTLIASGMTTIMAAPTSIPAPKTEIRFIILSLALIMVGVQPRRNVPRNIARLMRQT